MDWKRNLNWISTLRGIAILLVFFSHLSSQTGASFKFIIGRIGVVIFFLISGFLTVTSRRKRNRKQYLFNRFVRMYPVYWVILILACIVNILFSIEEISLKRFVLNMTLFEQFLGEKEILGASWMMPIQVSFFTLIALFGVDIFINKISKVNFSMKTITMTSFVLLAILTGVVRHITGIQFPTAFFLLIAVAFIGINVYDCEIIGGGTRRLLLLEL